MNFLTGFPIVSLYSWVHFQYLEPHHCHSANSTDFNEIHFNFWHSFWFRENKNQDDLREKEITEVFGDAFNSQIRGKTEHNLNHLLMLSLHFNLILDYYWGLIASALN